MTKETLALNAVASFLRGEDDCDGIPDVAGFADFEPVTVTLNARTVRMVLDATE